MQRVVIGTAGHIDHGKTSLLEALTGIDCDRWAEEKERGITIDLGFAHLEDAAAGSDPLQIGFVDVPGHERFLHNALAGLGGIRVMLLVVAADEGVKPQTHEHLAICSLLEIPHGLVAVTKRDLVDDELLELAQLEIAEELEGTPFEGAPMLAVSSTTGEGIDELRRALLELARRVATPEEAVQAPFRLPIDRAFQLRGLGAIVTGTLISGTVQPGQTLSLLPTDASARVRSLQVHGEGRERATAGERTALQLTGVELASLERGTQLATPETFAAGKSLCARFRLLADAAEPISTFVPIRFHLYASEVLGKLRALGEPIEPGGSGMVEIRLARPVVAVRGDRFIIRRPSPAATLGGGEILDPAWRRRRGRSLGRAVKVLDDPERALELWVAEGRERGAAAAELAPRLGCRPAELAGDLDRLASAGRLLSVDTRRGRRWVAPAAVQRVLERGRGVLKRFFDGDRLARGMPKAQFLGQVLPRRAGDLSEAYLGWLAAAEVLAPDGDLVNLPGRTASLSGEESKLSARLLAKVESAGLTPPSPGDLAVALGAKQQILEGVQRFLVEQDQLVRLPSGLLLSAAAIETLKGDLLAAGWDTFDVARFKDRFDLTRKWAIPLLEHLDSVGFTRRIGDQRQIVRRG